MTRHHITCTPPRDCFTCPHPDCIRSGASRELPTKEELKFMNTGKARPYSRTAPKKPPKPKKPKRNPCFIDAGELTEKQRERLTARIMKEISRPGKER